MAPTASLGNRCRRWRTAALCVVSSIFISDSVSAEPEYTQRDIEAAILAKLPDFVRWPEGRQPFANRTALIVAVLGQPELANQLSEQFLSGPSPDRPVVVLRAGDLADVGRPHILFVGADHLAHSASIVSYCHRMQILSVAESPGAGARGISFNFFRDGGRVRFEINHSVLSAAGLRASYQLLSLARVVDKPGGTP